MKRYVLALTFGIVSTLLYAQENCQKFRTGNFQNMDNGILKATIQRNNSIQTEQYGNKEVTLKIIWIDDCTYRLQFMEGNEAFWNSRPKNMPTPDMITHILEINGNTYLKNQSLI